jgi:hypothetical protein
VIRGAPLRPRLEEALLRRRRELSGLLAEPPGSAARDPFGAPAAGDDDPEERLRHLMVVLWPAVRRAPLDGAARDAFLVGLAGLEQAARGSDPRFLDAWNHGFEAIASWPGALREEGVARFVLERYARLLDHHLAAEAGAA